MPTRREERAAREARDQALRAQLRHAVFGDRPANEIDQLAGPERWWSQHYQWLKDSGYVLRPRYTPEWTPSWKNSNKDWFLCEDGRSAPFATRILDATRVSDGAYVTLKRIDKVYHPYEVEIAQYLSSPELAASANHCVPIYDVLPIPDEVDKTIIVMPLLHEYLDPSFKIIGESVECFRQLFEGLQFMHQHHVAHRDCTSRNIMMDAKQLFIDAFHPWSPRMKRDFTGYARYKTRTERPPKYFLIDFGLSRRYDPSVTNPLEDPIWGADKKVPEFQNSNDPRDPFPTDVFYIGNTIKNDFIELMHGFEFMEPLIVDMVQNDPSKRPTMDEVVERFTIIRASLSTWKLRSRVVRKREKVFQKALRATLHQMRSLMFVVRGVPPVPTF